jgi:diaminopimelate decarboxylase
VLAQHLGALCVTIASEPGDFLVKEMGVLLTEVVKRRRDGHRFVGVDAGFNVAPERRIYDEPIPLLLCRAADAPRRRPVTVAGNINEGDDLSAEDLSQPEVREGDVIALLRVGSYNRSMAHRPLHAAAGRHGRARPPRNTWAPGVWEPA